jgi:drug/metabolite transporter (DMT)-like permease
MEEISAIRTLSALVVYCLSGTLLTLVNKVAISEFPLPVVLLVVQNGVTVILLYLLTIFFPAYSAGKLQPLTVTLLCQWIPLVLLFIGMLLSSLFALQNTSAVTLIVLRNLTTLSVAFFEFFALGTTISWYSVVMLLGILAGSILYGINDLGYSRLGMLWLTVNVLCTTCYQIYIKKIISSLSSSGPGAFGPFEMSYLNNIISLPILVVLCGALNELSRMPDVLRSISLLNSFVVVISGFLGFMLSISAFSLNMLVSATSMMVANNVNKFAAIALSEIFLQQSLSTISAIGALLVLLFGWLYADTRMFETARSVFFKIASCRRTSQLLTTVLFVPFFFMIIMFPSNMNFVTLYRLQIPADYIFSNQTDDSFSFAESNLTTSLKTIVPNSLVSNESWLTFGGLLNSPPQTSVAY